MADGVPITAGSGTTILTDDTGAGGHAQVVKLAIATDGSATLIPADGTDGLLVNLGTNNDVTVTSISAGDNNIGNVDVATLPAMVTGSGSLTAAEQAVTLTLTGESAVAFQLTGTWVGTITFEASIDGSNWTTIYAMKAGDNVIATTATSNDIYRCTGAGFASVRARCSAYTSGTIVVTARAAINTSGVYLNFPIPAGTNNIGDVDVLTVPTVAGVAATTMNASSSDGATALTSTAQAIKASAGVLLGYYIYNPNSTAQFVQFYNTAQGSVTVGTTAPLFMVTIPPASAANLWMQPGGVNFSTAMSWAATSTAGGNGAPTTAFDAVCWYA